VDFFLAPSIKTAIISPAVPERGAASARRAAATDSGVTFTRERQTCGHRSDAIVLDGRQIVVERAMYSKADGLFWSAGSNALATRLTP